MEEKYLINAKVAREIAQKSDCLKNRVFKTIKECSKENMCKITWDISEFCKEAVDDLIIMLKKHGYEVKKIDDGLNINIEW